MSRLPFRWATRPAVLALLGGAIVAGAAGPARADYKSWRDVSSGALTCSYGTDPSGYTGEAECDGAGTWTLHVGCWYDPIVLTTTQTQDGGLYSASDHCWQSVNDVWITFG